MNSIAQNKTKCNILTPSAEAIYEARRLIHATLDSRPDTVIQAALESCVMPLPELEEMRRGALACWQRGETVTPAGLSVAIESAGLDPVAAISEMQRIIDAGSSCQPARSASIIMRDAANRRLIADVESYAGALQDAARRGDVEMLRALKDHDPLGDGDIDHHDSPAIGKRVDLREWQSLANRPIPFIADYVPRKCVSVLAAPGGSGKSMVAIALALGVLRGATLLPSWHCSCSPGRVVMLSAEDPPEVVARRISDAGRLHGMGVDEISEALTRMTLYAGGGSPILAETPGGGLVFTEAAATIRAAIAAARPDLIIIDPIIRFHGGNENNNATAAAFVDYWARIAEACFAGVLLVHHTAKTARDAAAVEAGHIRGASAFTDQARSVLTLSPGDAGTGQTGQLVLRNVKNNYAPLGAPIALEIRDGAICESLKDFAALAESVLRYLAETGDAITLGGIQADRRGPGKALREAVVRDHPWATAKDIRSAAENLVRTQRVRLQEQHINRRKVQVLVAE